ncbi:hypothetical protein Tco_0499922 [Tanacetum coccineum]
MLNLLKINADLFTCDTPLRKNFDEFSRLSGMDDNLFAYEVKLPEPSQALAVILINGKLIRLIDITLKKWLDLKFGDHRKVDKEVMESVNALWIYWKRGDDDEVLTDEELFDLEKENLDEENKIEEALKQKAISEGSRGHETRKGLNFCAWMKKYFGTNYDDTIQTNQEWFDKRKSKGDNDNDIEDLDDYLVRDDAPFIINEEGERFKEKRCKLLGIPYKKPPNVQAFGGNTRDLGSFGEETDKTTNQHQDFSRFKVSAAGDGVTIYARRRHTSSSDGVTTFLDGVSPHRLNSDPEDSTL